MIKYKGLIPRFMMLVDDVIPDWKKNNKNVELKKNLNSQMCNTRLKIFNPTKFLTKNEN